MREKVEALFDKELEVMREEQAAVKRGDHAAAAVANKERRRLLDAAQKLIEEA